MNIFIFSILLISIPSFVAGTTSVTTSQTQSTVNGPSTYIIMTNEMTSSITLQPTPSVTSSQGVMMTSSLLSSQYTSSSQIMQPVSSTLQVAQTPIPSVTPQSLLASLSTSIRQETTTSATSITPLPTATPLITPTPGPKTPMPPITPITPITDPMEVIRRNIGLVITVAVGLLVCIALTVMCCIATFCCICCYKLTRRNKSGYRRTEVLGDYPEDFSVNTTRLTYQRIRLGDASTENVELATLGAAFEERRKKIMPEHYKKHLDTLWAVDLADLREEFDMLEVSKIRQNSIVANLHNEIQKNKDFKLVPYDSNRVKLKNVANVTSSDYINASFIRAPNIDQLFIAAQAPMEGTVNHFWQSVIEQDISNIVMLIPTGAEQQFSLLPSETNPVKQSEQLELCFEGEEQELCATFRRFKIKNELGNVKHVLHGQFREWTTKIGVPKFQHSFIKFIIGFKQRMILDNSPILVYSLTGSGQTGLFIATYTLLQLINVTMPVSVFDTVFRLLEQRVCIIQSLEEYKFLHLAVLEMIYSSTELLSSEFPDTYRSYVDSLRDSYRSIFHQQFSELDYQVDKTHKRSQDEANNPINRTKNTLLSVLPYDDTRVSLFSEFWEASDYINASYIDGYLEPQYFIATMHPVRETILEFLQMVYQCSATLVVLLATEDEFALLETGLDGSVSYWSEEKQGFGMYSVENLGSTNSAGLTRNKIKITNHSEKSSHTFIQYICVNFLDNNRPTNSQAVIHLTGLITKFRQEYKDNPVIVHCWDGIGKTGVLLASCIAIHQLISENKVDLFHVVKGMRRGREKMVTPVDLYIACFDIIKDYIVTSEQTQQEPPSPGLTVKVNM